VEGGLGSSDGHCFGIQEGFEVSKEVMMERGVRKVVELRYLGRN
jgi:hypothetical protein